MTKDFEKYDHTVNYLYSLQKHGIKLGLSNTVELMKLLGEPHKAFRCIHIAGTNGKGSTASMIASILNESGFKTGLFTSPHLVSFTERIRINGLKISENDVINLAAEVRKLVDGTDLNPTFFEFVTSMAFHYFAVHDVDWAVIETGLGGRLDSTNIVRPEATVITNISLDHCEFLGNTISDITFEKAGIIKQGVPLITASSNQAVINQLSEIAESLNAPVHIYQRDFSGCLKNMNDMQITMDYSGMHRYRDLSVPLTGKHQLDNACTAIRTCEVLKEGGLSVSEEAVVKGLKNVVLEGRLEWISQSPPIILDGAHNPDASKSLAASLMDIFPEKKIILITGVMSDKDIKETIEPLVNIADSIILTKAQYERAASSDKLSSIISTIHRSEAKGAPVKTVNSSSVLEAIEIARKQCTDNSIILITGSFYTTGEAKEVLGHKAVLSKLRE